MFKSATGQMANVLDEVAKKLTVLNPTTVIQALKGAKVTSDARTAELERDLNAEKGAVDDLAAARQKATSDEEQQCAPGTSRAALAGWIVRCADRSSPFTHRSAILDGVGRFARYNAFPRTGSSRPWVVWTSTSRRASPARSRTARGASGRRGRARSAPPRTPRTGSARGRRVCV